MTSFSSILCPVDFSATARRALSVAVQVARKTRAKLRVLHVLPIVGTPDEQKAAAEELRKIAPAEFDDVVLDRTVERAATPDAAILAAIDRFKTDLVVIGTHGRTGWRRALLGSVAERVVQLAPCALLTVAPSAGAEVHALHRVLVAHDFSASSDAALGVAIRLARASDAELVVLHVAEPVLAPLDYGAALVAQAATDPAVLRSLRTRLQEVVDAAVRGTVRSRVGVEVGASFERVADRARAEDADLVVVGSHGRRGWKHLLLGSTAERVVRLSDRPVLVVKPGAVGRSWRSFLARNSGVGATANAPARSSRDVGPPPAVEPRAEPHGVVDCDVCGARVRRESALTESLGEETTYYCGPECFERREFIEIDRGPERDDR